MVKFYIVRIRNNLLHIIAMHMILFQALLKFQCLYLLLNSGKDNIYNTMLQCVQAFLSIGNYLIFVGKHAAALNQQKNMLNAKYSKYAEMIWYFSHNILPYY
jgi:hypothetical protein